MKTKMSKLDARIYALQSINELLERLDDMKTYLHKYDYDKHTYTDIIEDADGEEKIKILDIIEDFIIENVASNF